MKATILLGAALCLALQASICHAQQATIPFEDIERKAKLNAALRFPEAPALNGESSSSVAPELFVALPSREPSEPASRPLGAGFFLLNGLHLGVAALDVAMTQHCIAAHRCREGNPLMPASLAGQLTVDLSLVSYGSISSYRLKKRGSRAWWLMPAVGAVAHGVGSATGMAHY